MACATRFTGDLSTDTPLLPEIIADSVVREGAEFVPQLRIDHGELSRSIADQLAEKARAIYTRDCAKKRFGETSFAGKMHSQGDGGRDCLRLFMRHWFAAIALKNFNVRAPSRFANGLPI